MKKESNRMIIVTGCFKDCPYKRHDDGGGHCSEFEMCDLMDKLIYDREDFDKVNKWRYDKKGNENLFHPDCPLRKTNLKKQKGMDVHRDEGFEYEDEDEDENEGKID